MAIKYDIPDTYLNEYTKWQELFLLGTAGRASYGSGTFVSSTSAISYPYTDGGDLFTQLQAVLQDYLITASDWNEFKNTIHEGSYAVSTNVGSDYTITFTTPYTSYVAGQTFKIKFNATNTGASTIKVDGLGLIDIRKNYDEVLIAGDIVINEVRVVVYDGTNFQIQPREIRETYVETTGSANVYVATFTAIPYKVYTAGMTLKVKFNVENTSASTINVDGLGAKTIKKVTGAGIEVLEAGDIIANGVYIVVYDGIEDAFILSNQFKVKPMMEAFTSSGTFTAPFTGNYEVTITGGGGGGGTSTTVTGGGGGGGTAIEVTSLTKGEAVTVTIGAGGSLGTTTGNTGGTTSFGGYCSATGGLGGRHIVSGFDAIGGGGGNGSGGDLNLIGGAGGIGHSSSPYGVNGFGGSTYFGGGGNSGGIIGVYGCGGTGNHINSSVSQDGVCIVKWMEG